MEALTGILDQWAAWIASILAIVGGFKLVQRTIQKDVVEFFQNDGAKLLARAAMRQAVVAFKDTDSGENLEAMALRDELLSTVVKAFDERMVALMKERDKELQETFVTRSEFESRIQEIEKPI